MSCSERNREGGEDGEYDKPVARRSVEGGPRLVSQNGSITAPQLTIDRSLLVDPKLLFIGSKIGEGAHGKVYEGRFVQIFFKTCFVLKFKPRCLLKNCSRDSSLLF